MQRVYTSVEGKFPGAGYRAIGALFFLRFICPILVAPITFGAIKEKYSPLASNTQRGLILVAKLIQNIANESIDFGKQHEFMKPFTNLVQKHIPLIRGFYDSILRAEGQTLRSRIPCTPHQLILIARFLRVHCREDLQRHEDEWKRLALLVDMLLPVVKKGNIQHRPEQILRSTSVTTLVAQLLSPRFVIARSSSGVLAQNEKKYRVVSGMLIPLLARAR